MFRRDEYYVLLVGLDDAGKTVRENELDWV